MIRVVLLVLATLLSALPSPAADLAEMDKRIGLEIMHFNPKLFKCSNSTCWLNGDIRWAPTENTAQAFDALHAAGGYYVIGARMGEYEYWFSYGDGVYKSDSLPLVICEAILKEKLK